ncbi:pyridoxal-phosphate dependent enzyme [Rhodococcoides fascians A25f]|uniref:pyridoxal-phosphate dependent enzyme n=1 Tax=Rhodococcoides fascians TaxID=1828 RepID=UPI00069103AD|nr:pyridoxal-phosphate dependent enzyme [Rhodococcus fascians]QII04305.1 pyridoxal-phosphate dependent enzyme [Rhodococcus fascians A25f]
MLSDSVIDAIGNTPSVRLHLPQAPEVRFYAKLEMSNLFAMKDRVARNIILRARESGTLAEGATIVESSSGTMALGVALVGRSLGHPVHIVTDPRIDAITLSKLEALGCVVHIVSAMDGFGWQGARLTQLAKVMKDHPGSFWPRQYENPDNPAAYRTLADELLSDIGTIDIVIGSVGSGGSLCGTTRALRERLPQLRSVGVDCVGSVLFGQPDMPKRLQSGLGNSMHPLNLDHSVIDEVHWLNDREAYAATRDLAREHQLFAGNTSGSVYRVASAVAATAPPGTTIVGIFPDRGDRYASTVHSNSHWEEKRVAALPLRGRPRLVLPDAVVDAWAYSLPRAQEIKPVFVFIESNTSGSGMVAIATAARLGFRVLFLTENPGRYRGLAEAPCETVQCDTGDQDAVISVLDRTVPREHLSGAGTTSEFYVETVARLATSLGLPSVPPEAVERCRNKAKLRAILAEHGCGQPEYRWVPDARSAREAAAGWPMPCVVKPVDETGSTGVRCCTSETEAVAQIEAITAAPLNGRGQQRAPGALLESFADGPEYSVEMFGINGELRLFGIVEKTLLDSVNFVESRHVLPASVPPVRQHALVEAVRAALNAVGMTEGPTHTELRWTAAGPSIIEINPRLAGGMIPELVALASGVDLLEQQIRYLGGLPVCSPPPPNRYSGIQFLTVADRGILAEVTGVDEARAIPGVMQVTVNSTPGESVGPAHDAYGRLGYVIAVADDRGTLDRALDAAAAAIGLKVESALAEFSYSAIAES